MVPYARSTIMIAICSMLSVGTTLALASGPREPSIIRPPDDRMDYFQVDAAQQGLGDAVCAMIRNAQTNNGQGLRDNGDGTFTLVGDTLDDQQGPLCDDEPFATQPAIADCSVTLVASDIVVTAGHCFEADGGVVLPLENWFFVFDYVMRNANTNPMDFTTPQVYTVGELLGRENDEGTARDWAVVRLDRAVEGTRTPIPVRESGDPAIGTPVMAIGFGAGLPMKFSANATVQELIDFGFTADLDIIAGNSGSGVINTNTNQLEGVLSNDIGVDDFTDDGQRNCRRATRCPDDPVCQDGFTQMCKVTLAEFQQALRTAGVIGGGGDGGNDNGGGGNDNGGGGNDNGGNDNGGGGTTSGFCGFGAAGLVPFAVLGLLLVRCLPMRRRQP